ncbi:unnamed protein product [Pleuronectes platessa]|uniref:LTD domain-containing protein n=1 Tax=Pleuronectes platessa TaxID=8262 RepID=A0A9N7Z2B7_PLEPL|nr:unnamed protein product [Pleuronectes platessa]
MCVPADCDCPPARRPLERQESFLYLGSSLPIRPLQRSELCHQEAPANDTDSEASSFAGGAVARTRITQQASASGRVTVEEVDQEGKYVRLSNKSDEDQNLGSWQVRRQVGSGAAISFKFPAKFTLKAGQRVTIWASGAGGAHNPPSDLVWKTQTSWGTGDVFQTTLISASGDEMAMRKVTRTQFEDEDDDMQVAHSTCGDGEYNLRSRTWSVAPVDFPRTNPAAAPCPRPPAPSAAEASPRVYCPTPTCSAALLARLDPEWRPVQSCEPRDPRWKHLDSFSSSLLIPRIPLDVECSGSVWDRGPGDVQSRLSPCSDGDMSSARCS